MSIWWALTEGSHKNLSVLLLSLTIVPFPCAFQAHNENTEKTNRKSLKQSPDCRPFDLAYDTIDRAFSKAFWRLTKISLVLLEQWKFEWKISLGK